MYFSRAAWTAAALLAAACLGFPAAAEDIPSVAARFASQDVREEPSFQRHVLPLMGRLGCNGRACHGSFQGQGGFRLSLFGYDFETDHKTLLDAKSPRVDPAKPLQSLLLVKPLATNKEDHGGGHRLDQGSWQYHVLRRWIESGAKNDALTRGALKELQVTPAEIQFTALGEKKQLRAVAVWTNGDREDVTPICRFQTNDGSIAEVGPDGVVSSTGKGDTHLVVFYDNGITPVPVLLPISAETARSYPAVPRPTRIDELVGDKQKKLGVVPAELCSDEEFLRRASLDITGTLPAPEEITKFLADSASDKRARKIDELLERPGHAAWWAVRICDITGNAFQVQGTQNFREQETRQWYEWVYRRLRENQPYDRIVAGIVLSAGRTPGQSYTDYCREMASYFREKDKSDFAARETMPHYWSRRNARMPEDRALSFSYAFLGVRLQCAQCHKHPFDQWSKHDFEQFTAFFTGIQYGVRPEDKETATKMKTELGLNDKSKDINKLLPQLLQEGKLVPFEEVFVTTPKPRPQNKDPQAKGGAARVITPKLLGGEQVVLDKYGDPRAALMEWLRHDDNPYFARAIVNRVWANYFNVGIVEPADDMNLANPPSNAPLLDYLTREFVAQHYDLKWLHRTICNSRAYQLSWKTNDTNRLDLRNFSHAVPRRLPAEVVLDAINQATASAGDAASASQNITDRAIGPASGLAAGIRGRGSNYALMAFGKPARNTNCDCERSGDPSLLQTLYLRNDNEMFTAIDRPGGWLAELAKANKSPSAPAAAPAASAPRVPPAGRDAQTMGETLDRLRDKIKALDEKKDAPQLAELRAKEQKLVARLTELKKASAEKPASPPTSASPAASSPTRNSEQCEQLVREAYLRTLSRRPTDGEIARGLAYLNESPSLTSGVRDLVWALLNTKEFILNH